MAEDLGNQLKLQIDFNKALKAQVGLLQQSARLLSQQAGYAKQMCDAIDCAPMGEMSTQTQEATEGLKKAADQAEKTSESMGGLRKTNKQTIKTFKDLLEYLEKNSVAFGATLGAARAFIGGFKMGWGMIKGFTKGIFSLIGTFASLAQSIISIPFKMLTGLIKMSQTGGVDPLRQALEKLRGEYGSLATNEGKMFVDSVKETRKEASNLAGTGLSLTRVFGYGREGLAKLLEFNAETAKAMGIAFGNLRGEFAKNSVALAMYRKGLGMTAEQQAVMLKVSKARGQSMKESQLEFASMAIQMGEKFGVNAKVVGKAMGEMAADVSNFGHMSVKQLGATAVYAAKLGIEVKDLMAVFDKFDNFETAAQGAAQLSQAFGMNVDAMAMLKAESPAEAIDILRKSFFAAGNSLETMNRHQRKLLEQQTGLKGAAMEAAFANKNMGMSYDDIQAGAEEAEKKQLSQAEAMVKLSDSIERMVRSGQHQFESFFDAFSKGFSKGILRSKEFRGIMRNLRRSLRIIYRAGIQVGRMFVKMFPGVKDVLGGLRDIFNPEKFKVLARSLVGVFRTFFTDMQRSPQRAVQNLLDNLTKMFTGHFGASGGALKRIKEGFKTFFKAMGGIIAGLIPIIKKNLAEGLEKVIDLIVNPPSAAMSAAAKGAEGFVMSIFGPIWQAIAGNSKLNKRIWDGINTLFSIIWEKIKASTWAQKAYTYFWQIVAIKILMSTFINVFGGAMMGKLLAVISKGLIGLISGGAAAAAGPAAAAATTALAPVAGAQASVLGLGSTAPAATAAGPSLLSFLAMLGTIIAALAAVVVIYKLADLKPMDAVGIGVMLAAIAASMALMTPPLLLLQATPLTLAVVPSVLIMAGVMTAMGLVGAAISLALASFTPPTTGAVLAWGAIMMTMIVTSLPLIAIAYIMSNLAPQMVQATTGMPILGAFMLATGAIGAIVAGLLSAFAGENAAKVGILMEGIASIIWSTLGMIPAAIAIGWAFTGPQAVFGAAGVALALTGFSVLAVLVGGMIVTLLPAIKGLAQIKLADPASFKATAEALHKIMEATISFVEAAGGILKDLKPWPWETDTLQGNMEAFGTLIDGMLKSGVTDTIDKMIELAKSSNIPKDAGPLVAAIGSVLSGIAGILTAFSPSDEVMKAVSRAERFRGTGAVIMGKVTEHIEAFKPVLLGEPGKDGLFKIVGSFIVDLAKSLAGYDLSKVGPLLSAIGPIFGSVASLMTAMSPTEGAFQTVVATAETFTEDSARQMMRITRHMRLMMPKVKELIETIGTQMGLLIDKLTPLIQKIGEMKIKPKALAAVGDIIGGIMGGFGAFMTSLAPLVQSAEQTASKHSNASEVMAFQLTNIGDFAGTMMDTLKDSMPNITAMIEGIVGVAKGIANPRKVKQQVGVIASIFEIMATIGGLFSPDGALHNKQIAASGDQTGKWSIPEMRTSMNDVTDLLLQEGGPVDKMVKALSGLKPPKRGTSKKLKAISSIMSSTAEIGASVKSITRFGEDAGDPTASINNMSIALAALDTLLDAPHLMDPKKAAIIAKSIQTLDGALTRPLATFVQDVKPFAGGNLLVTHHLPGTTIEVVVNLNAKELAKKVATVDISKDSMVKGYLGHGLGPDKSKVASK